MARQIDTKNTVLLPQEKRDEIVNQLDEVDGQYLRERPWMIQEYEAMGYNEQMKSVREGFNGPQVDPAEASRVTTDDMRVGSLPTKRRVQPNGVVPPEEDEVDDDLDDEDDYDAWTKTELLDEVERRNKELADDQKLAISGTKQELVDRLRADDESTTNA